MTPAIIIEMAEQWQHPIKKLTNVPTNLGQNQKAPKVSKMKLPHIIRVVIALYIQTLLHAVPYL